MMRVGGTNRNKKQRLRIGRKRNRDARSLFSIRACVRAWRGDLLFCSDGKCTGWGEFLFQFKKKKDVQNWGYPTKVDENKIHIFSRKYHASSVVVDGIGRVRFLFVQRASPLMRWCSSDHYNYNMNI